MAALEQSTQEKFYDAITSLIEDRVNKAEYNKTLECLVVSCLDSSLGEYKVKYQDQTFSAFSEGDTYEENTSVYVLIPNNDYTKKKYILGSSAVTTATYAASQSDTYKKSGDNIITLSSQQILKSGENNSITIYNYEDTSSNKAILINDDVVNYALGEYNYIIIVPTIKTKLNSSQMTGNYGINVTIDYSSSYTDGNDAYQVTFTVDTENVSGNPYSLTDATRIFCPFKNNPGNFIRISNIEFFAKDFSTSIIENDIYLTDLEIYGGELMASNEYTGYNIKINSNKYYFDDATDSEETLSFSAKLYNNDEEITDEYSTYWFIEDKTIDITSDNYNKAGGIGWRLISSELNATISKSLCQTAKKHAKCIIEYNDENYYYTFDILNTLADYIISITSSDSNNIYSGIGAPTLTCSIIDANTEAAVDEGTIVYSWYVMTNDNKVDLNSDTDELTLDMSLYDGEITVYCEVYLNDTYIGSDTVELTNSKYADAELQNVNNEYVQDLTDGTLSATLEAATTEIENTKQHFYSDDDGAHVIDDNKDYRIDIKDEGVYINDISGDEEIVVSQFTKDKTVVGAEDNKHVVVSSDGIELKDGSIKLGSFSSQGLEIAGVNNDENSPLAELGYNNNMIGVNNVCLGNKDFAVGMDNVIEKGESSYALGIGNTINGDNSFTLGVNNLAVETSSFAFGLGNKVNTKYSFAFGRGVETRYDNQTIFGVGPSLGVEGVSEAVQGDTVFTVTNNNNENSGYGDPLNLTSNGNLYISGGVVQQGAKMGISNSDGTKGYLFLRAEREGEQITIDANSYNSGTIPIHLDGYIPLCIAGFRPSAAYGVYKATIDDGAQTATLGLRNTSSSTIRPILRVTILYIKDISM